MKLLRGGSAFFAPALAASALTLGCEGSGTTVFAPGLDPIAQDSVPPPGADGGTQYPQTLALTQGTDGDLSGGGYNYVFASGYVDASIASVWAAFKIPNVVVDRHAITSYSVTNNVETGYDVSFLTAYSINAAPTYTVTYNLTWREGVVGGTEANPSQVSVVYEKTSGTNYVTLMEGSIELISVTPTVTELQFAQRMNATDTTSATIAAWTNEMFASVIAQVNGQPLP